MEKTINHGSDIQQLPPANDNWPLILTRRQAAEMCKVSVQTFDAWVRKEILPGPIPRTRRWSRIAIEGVLAGGSIASSFNIGQSAFEQWKSARAH
jgi:hypothetical protein